MEVSWEPNVMLLVVGIVKAAHTAGEEIKKNRYQVPALERMIESVKVLNGKTSACMFPDPFIGEGCYFQLWGQKEPKNANIKT